MQNLDKTRFSDKIIYFFHNYYWNRIKVFNSKILFPAYNIYTITFNGFSFQFLWKRTPSLGHECGWLLHGSAKAKLSVWHRSFLFSHTDKLYLKLTSPLTITLESGYVGRIFSICVCDQLPLKQTHVQFKASAVSNT